MDYLFLVIWFVLLIKWADTLVNWASSIAKKYGISSLVIWLTIVAFWSSAPELVVNLISWYSWNTALAISNIVWSNISNILLILWLTAILYPIKLPSSTVKKEIPFLIVADLVLILLLISDWIISRYDALILIIMFAIFLYYTFKISKIKTSDKEEDDIEIMSSLKSIIYVILWLTGLILWWHFIVESAISIAKENGLPEAFIWVTIVAIWTSLPELAVSIMAAFKKNTDMAIWAIVGSNIFNTLWILWATWLLTPLAWYSWLHIDLWVNLVASILIFAFAFTLKKFILDRTEWFILLTMYISYIWYLVFQL